MWGGMDCSLPVDPCFDAGACSFHGACSSAGLPAGTYTCSCYDGWAGPRCSTPAANACSARPCVNGGTCVTGTTPSTFQCRCIRGFTGTMCEQVDACWNNPCRNGGSCVNQPLGADDSQYSCSCRPGFTGTQCERSAAVTDAPGSSTRCAGGVVTCLNGGSCLSRGDGSSGCQCRNGYSGSYCEQRVTPGAECGQITCQNYGTCVNSKCMCLEGWGGQDCSVWKRLQTDCQYCGPLGVCYVAVDQPSCYCPEQSRALCSYTCPTPHAMQPHPFNCKLFIKCDWYKPYVMECPAPLHFNPVLNVCDWPPNVNCGPAIPIYEIYRRPLRK